MLRQIVIGDDYLELWNSMFSNSVKWQNSAGAGVVDLYSFELGDRWSRVTVRFQEQAIATFTKTRHLLRRKHLKAEKNVGLEIF